MFKLFRGISKVSSPLNRSLWTTPYLLTGKTVVGKSPCGGMVVKLNVYDPRREEQLKMESQILSKNICGSLNMGSSRGWLVTIKKSDSSVLLTNINKIPSKTISLPPLIYERTDHILNVSVSSSSEEDCVVAVKFVGSRLSLCRVGDSEWTRIDVPCPAFSVSPVMYSDTDRKFYLNSCSSNYSGSTDFTSTSGPGLLSPVSGYVRFALSEFPKLDNRLHLQRANVMQLLVHSPCGQSFIVLWGADCFTDKGEVVEWKDERYKLKDLHIKTHTIKVFRQDTEKGIGPYTEDIGDLCIFIGENEPFCLSASHYPGLKPNSVYFGGHSSGFGVFDLASRTIRYLSHSPRNLLFWIPPTTPH